MGFVSSLGGVGLRVLRLGLSVSESWGLGPK